MQTSFLGDTVLTTPLIAELAKRGPVDVVVTPVSAPLLANNPSVRRVVVYDKRGADGGLSGLWRAARELRGRRSPTEIRPRRERRKRRIAYLAQGSVRSALLAMLAGVRERVGFSTSSGRSLYTRHVLCRDDRHQVERLWRLAFPDEPDIEPGDGVLRPRLFPGDEEVATVERLLAEHAVREPFVALAPGSIWGTKRWPYYADLARRIAGQFGIAVIGSAADAGAARAIADAIGGGRVLDTTGRLSLLASAELIARAAVLVTNDSAPQHLASAMGTPTVTLFGPTVPDFGFGPLAPRSRALGNETLPCRPCHHHGPQRCPLGHWRCMRELDVERVLEAVQATVRTE